MKDCGEVGEVSIALNGASVREWGHVLKVRAGGNKVERPIKVK